MIKACLTVHVPVFAIHAYPIRPCARQASRDVGARYHLPQPERLPTFAQGDLDPAMRFHHTLFYRAAAEAPQSKVATPSGGCSAD